MKKKLFSVEQMVGVQKQAEVGVPVAGQILWASLAPLFSTISPRFRSPDSRPTALVRVPSRPVPATSCMSELSLAVAMLVSYPLNIPITTAFSVIDFSGVFAGALGGAFAARENKHYQYDFVGVMGLALISALGGGIARDVLLNHGPPLALVDTRYLLVAMVGGALGLAVSHKHAWLRRALVAVDAVALGLFAVAGSTRAVAAGLTFLPAVLLGVTTAVGGGSLRDVFSGRTPQVFERGEPYAIVAAVASVVFLIAERWLGPGAAATTLAVACSFILRLVAMRFRWKTQAAR